MSVETKHEIRNTKSEKSTNNKIQKTKKYDLEERSLKFALHMRLFIKQLPRTLSNIEDGKQAVRSSGSVGANYIEANESLGKKDFLMKIKICRKEAKETRYWLHLLEINNNPVLERERSILIQESTELMSIFSSIMRKFTW